MELYMISKEELDNMGEHIINAVAMLLKEKNKIEQEGMLYSNKEACSYLKVCDKTLQNYRNDGLLKFSQIGRKIYYKKQDLDSFLEKYKKELFFNHINNKQHA